MGRNIGARHGTRIIALASRHSVADYSSGLVAWRSARLIQHVMGYVRSKEQIIPRSRSMRIAIAVLALAFVVIGPASAESAKSFAPEHHAKGVHGSSFYAPGHEKKRLHMQSARRVAPGHLKY